MPREAKLITYLVFESTAPGSPSGAPDSHYRAMGQDTSPRPYLDAYTCLGAVNAEDPQQAAMAVMSVTRRISKFAVIEAEIIDFQPGVGAEAEGRRIELNP